MRPWCVVGRAARAWVVAAALLGAACAGSGPLATRSGSDGPAPEVRELRGRVIELQRRAAVTEIELERLRRQVAELEARLEGRPVPEPSEPSEPARSRSGQEERPPGPEPVIEIEDVSDGPPPERSAPRAVEEEPASRPETASGEDRPAPPTPPAPETGEVTDAAQALYDRGYTLYHQRRYVDAESTFRRFIQSYPSTELTDNARYWIGESRLARDDVRGALAAFRETVERHPDGNKVPAAFLKQGISFHNLGENDNARLAMQELLRKFPDANEAAIAR
ncbi:MAG: tol-pal system protein YbgF, partial [Acidobacteriota bacterium]